MHLLRIRKIEFLGRKRWRVEAIHKDVIAEVDSEADALTVAATVPISPCTGWRLEKVALSPKKPIDH